MLRFTAILMATLLIVAPARSDEDDPDVSPAARVQVPQTTDLTREGALSRKRRLPIMLVFSADYCHYCRLLEEEFLKPMLISGDYDDKVIIRVVDISGLDEIRDFNGALVSADTFATGQGVFVTPTVKFLDDRGRDLVPKMVGITTIDFYGWYLDEAIESSLARLRAG